LSLSTTTAPSRRVRALCRKRLAALDVSPAPHEDRVVQVVQGNLANGRFERFARGQRDHRTVTLTAYIDNVIFHASREQARVQRLEDGDAAEWNRLRDSLAHRACCMVRSFRNGHEAYTEALDFAQQTCLIVFNQRYPFDVSLDAWVGTILKNLVLTRYRRSSDVLSRPHAPDSLDEVNDPASGGNGFLNELLADSKSLAPFERVENQMVLLQAIERLRSRAQRQVITATFLEELDDAQIAKWLGKSKQAVYNLRQRALARLRVILAQTDLKEKGTKKHQ